MPEVDREAIHRDNEGRRKLAAEVDFLTAEVSALEAQLQLEADQSVSADQARQAMYVSRPL